MKKLITSIIIAAITAVCATAQSSLKKIYDEDINQLEQIDKAIRQASDETAQKMMKKLGNPGRFGFPALVVMDGKGKILHTQDSSLLEEGNGYNKDKVLRFFRNWTPEAVAQ